MVGMVSSGTSVVVDEVLIEVLEVDELVELVLDDVELVEVVKD